jgi:hypothetical protein
VGVEGVCVERRSTEQGERLFEFHAVPNGTEPVGDLDVWESLLAQGVPMYESKRVFAFHDRC